MGREEGTSGRLRKEIGLEERIPSCQQARGTRELPDKAWA